MNAVEPWPPDEADRLARTAHALAWGDEWHRSGRCHHGTRMERMSCGTCALLGYEPRGGWGDGYKVSRDGPNYAGWPRVYVEARLPIPVRWRPVVDRHTSDTYDNQAYSVALRRSIATFGVHYDYDE